MLAPDGLEPRDELNKGALEIQAKGEVLRVVLADAIVQ